MKILLPVVTEFHVACPHCNYSNLVEDLDSEYKEVVYQLYTDNNGKQDHNMKDRIRCDSCHTDFDFYFCAGHSK